MSVKQDVLGIILFDDLKTLDFNVGPKGRYPDLELTRDILRKHIGTKDILECKEELIENGLKDYAKL